MFVPSAVRDLSQTIALLDTHATADRIVTADGREWTRAELRNAVAIGLAQQFEWHLQPYIRKAVTKQMVSIAMAAHGAQSSTIEQHARAIAAYIRSDYTHGGQ